MSIGLFPTCACVLIFVSTRIFRVRSSCFSVGCLQVRVCEISTKRAIPTRALATHSQTEPNKHSHAQLFFIVSVSFLHQPHQPNSGRAAAPSRSVSFACRARGVTNDNKVCRLSNNDAKNSARGALICIRAHTHKTPRKYSHPRLMKRTRAWRHVDDER